MKARQALYLLLIYIKIHSVPVFLYPVFHEVLVFTIVNF